MKIIIYFIIMITLQLLIDLLNRRLFPRPTGSDNAIHFSIIRAVKKSNHSFITDVSKLNFFGASYFGYPHFYHIFLSFFSISFLERNYYLITFFINFLIILCWLLFGTAVYPHLGIINFSKSELILYGGVLFIFNPFNYYAWNARNIGISARGVGILFVHLFLYSSIFYLLTSKIIFLIFVYILSVLIMMTSQFAFQFILFFSLISGFFFGTMELVGSPILAFIAFLLINKRAAKNYLKMQYQHKKLYWKYVAPVSILIKRYSIWRDLVWDIWKKLFKDFRSNLLYTIYNPVLTLFLGFPALTVILFTYYIIQRQEIIGFSELVSFMFSFVQIALIIFFLTSFRKTRFLGEPERYVEMVLPFLPILLLILIGEEFRLLYFILGYSVLYCFVNIYHIYVSKNKISKHIREINKIGDFITKNRRKDEKERIACNGQGLIKYLIAADHDILYPTVTQSYIGSFHVKDIFNESLAYISKDVFVQLAIEFNVKWLVFNTNYYSISDLEDTSNLSFLVKLDEFEIARIIDRD